MADAMGLTVSNLKVSSQTVTDPATRMSSKQYTVSYMVGQHGPFTDTYAAKDYNHANVAAGINNQIQTLRSITASTMQANANG